MPDTRLDFAMLTSSSALLFICLVSLGAAAQNASERSELALVQRQLIAIELMADRANSSAVNDAGARYRFDYSRFTADLRRVRQGIHTYLSPSRAQPADLVEMTSEYRAEAPHKSHSDEHD